MGRIERLPQIEGNTKVIKLKAVCDDCGPKNKNGTFSGPVTIQFEFGQWIVGDLAEDKGTLAYKCVKHHLDMQEHGNHNHFQLWEKDKVVGECGIGGHIRYLAGVIRKPGNQG